jgi:hypothetical protein
MSLQSQGQHAAEGQAQKAVGQLPVLHDLLEVEVEAQAL